MGKKMEVLKTLNMNDFINQLDWIKYDKKRRLQIYNYNYREKQKIKLNSSHVGFVPV
tara:strand:+ start:835 stop:1005 length:171 start_codon:yes stop_codon:yes gene_type:complete